MEKKQLTLVVVSLLVVVLSVSVAYFTGQIIGEGKNVSVTSANLQIIFKDEDGAISSTDIEPGWTSTKTFTVKNSTKSEYKYNIVLKDLVNTFVTEGYLQYKITSTNNGYNMTEFKDVPKLSKSSDTVLAYNVSIPVGATQTYTVEFKYINDENVDQSKDMGKKLSGTLFITEGYKNNEYASGTLGRKLLSDKNVINTYRPNGFNNTFTDDNTNTLYTSTEDDTLVYYFAGNATDNWVKFGKYETDYVVYRGYSSSSTTTNYIEYLTLDECTSATYYNYNCSEYKYANANDDIYWRIVRTNADGSIRLLYHGTSPESTQAYIVQQIFYGDYISSIEKDPKYVGYMYGTNGSLENNRTNTNDSLVKKTIDTWYTNNLIENYNKYLSETAVYCNNRNIAEGYTYSLSNTFILEPYVRLQNNQPPTYDCVNTKDSFSVNNSEAKLNHPIALITVDELVYAGGKPFSDSSAYYYKNSLGSSSTYSNSMFFWWTMSPMGWNVSGNNYESYHYVVTRNTENPGRIGYGKVYSNKGLNYGSVRPVTSLKACVKYASGDGSADSPYTIAETDSGC